MTKDGAGGDGMAIAIMRRNATAAGMEVLLAPWGMTGALVEAVASGILTMGNCAS